MLRAIFSLLAVFLLAALAVYSISFILPELARQLGSGAYFAVPLSWVGGAIGGVVLSILADVWSRRFSLLISILLFLIPLFLNLEVRNLPELYLLWFTIGFGVNGENGLSYAYAAELSPSRMRGLVGSLMQGLYFLGGLLGLLMSYLLRNPFTYFLTVSLVVLLSLPLWVFIPESRFRGSGELSMRAFGGSTLKTLIFGSIFAVGSFLFVVPLVSLSFTLLTSLELPAFQTIVVALLVGLVGFTIAGRLSDRLGRKRTTYVFLVISLIFSSLMFLEVPSIVEFSVIALMFGSAFFAYFGVWMSEIFPGEVRATATNLVFFLGRLIGGGFGVAIVLLLPLGLQRDLAVALLASSILVGVAVSKLPETAKGIQ